MRMVIQTLPINRNNGKTRCLTDKTTPNNGVVFYYPFLGFAAVLIPLNRRKLKRFFVARRMDMRGCLRRMPCFIGV